MNKVELLAPAGDYETVLAAINAGADAIYVGLDRFSARAFAQNLTTDELCKAITLCHLHRVKLYLALNTLLNNSEIDEVWELIAPLYEAGLDGVIIQDMGVASIIKNAFPGLEMHASTQMSIMNLDGSKLLKESGFCRVVPARELSLAEIKNIKNNLDIELECFIHGAMCYSYSGLCLMSSIIGGRSGNRGKCAGTCRLPFRFHNEKVDVKDEEYPISMKDMCTIEILPQLILAGIDSFKIEGRMKSPEYCAGVTSLYRKYIDLYYNNPNAYKVDPKDIQKLRNLYIRTDICSGYYGIENNRYGTELITMTKPGYNGSSDELIVNLHNKYVREPRKIPVYIDCYMNENEPIVLNMNYGDVFVSASGGLVQKANNAPLDINRVKTQLSKLGDSPFIAEDINVHISGDIFAPMAMINQVRRECTEELIKAICEDNGFVSKNREYHISNTVEEYYNANSNIDNYERKDIHKCHIDVHLHRIEQLQACKLYNPDRMYLEHNLLFDLSVNEIIDIKNNISTENKQFEVYVSLPGVYRNIKESYFELLLDKINSINADDMIISGILVHSYDELYWAKNNCNNLDIVSDSHIYLHNDRSIEFISREFEIDKVVLPYELKTAQLCAIAKKCLMLGVESSINVYGYIPLMISAGCLKRTYKSCDHKEVPDLEVYLKDRKNHKFPVRTDCKICTNIIYNDRPLSLYKFLDSFHSMDINRIKINLIFEDEDTSEKILDAFYNTDADTNEYIRNLDIMTGHMNRGV